MEDTPMRFTFTLAFAAAGLLAAADALAAQGVAPAADPATDSVAPDSTPRKQGGGLFGKAKKFVGNKTVKAVAKTVACTMVPGGQAIAGAMDAASSKSAGEAAAGAAGVAGVTGGTGCMPGGMGAPGMTGAPLPDAGGLPGGLPGSVAGAGAGMAQAMSAGRGAAPTAAMGYSETPVELGEEDVARCLGLTVEEYRNFTDPTHGEARAPSKAEAKRQAKLSQKADTRRYQECLLQRQGAASNPAGAEPRVATPAVAERAAVRMSADPVGELRKGKTALRHIGWAPGAAELEDGAGVAFSDAMAKLALALRQAGGVYRADLYLEASMNKATAEHIGRARLAVVRDALDHVGLPANVLTLGKVKVDKEARLELVRAKK
jgi:hypothetical protein